MKSEEKKSKKNKNSRGTISVFLVLILVPCIIVSCLFGDISRVELSKAEAAAAGDLAMYSLLSHYDEELKEYYGLVASCQTIENFYDVTATYFTGMMSANGISGEGSELFMAYLQALQSGDISDFLQVEFVEPAKVAEPSNNAMGDNAALLEDSIVEFMKYRGPYEIVNNVLDILEKKNILTGLKGVEKDQPITEAREAYAEAESEMLKKALYVFIASKLYTDYYETKKVPEIAKYQEYEKHLAAIAQDFSKVTELITLYYAGTSEIKVVGFPMYSLSAYIKQIKPKNVGHKVKQESETLYCIDKKDLEDLLKDIDIKRLETEQAAANIAAVCSGLPDPTPADSDINPALFCVKTQQTVNSNDLNILSDRGNWLMKRYAELKAALKCDPYPEEKAKGKDKELPQNWEKQLEEAISKIESTHSICYSSNGSSDYLNFVKRYRKVAESNAVYAGGMDTVQNVKDRRYEFYSEYLGRNATIGTFLEAVRTEFSQIESDITTQIDNLNTIIYGGTFSYNGNSYTSVSLDTLKQYVLEYSSKRKSWGSSIYNSGSTSSYAEQEKAEYEGSADTEDEGAKLAAAIAEDGGKAVDDFKERLLNIRDDMMEYQEAVKNFKYGGYQITALNGREDAIQAGCKVIPGQTDMSLTRNREAAAGYHKSLLTPDASQVYKAPELAPGENGNNPDMLVDSPALYRLLRQQFGDRLTEIENEVKDNEKRNDEYKKKAEKEKKKALKVDNTYLKGKGANLNTNSHGGAAVNAFTAIGSMVTIMEQLFNGNGDELRDQLYVTEYVMDMFSYSSYNNEGQHRLAVQDGKQYSLEDFSESGYPGYTNLWAAEAKEKTPENQSLTNQPINAAHNRMNLGEVEYILYGNKSIDENLKTSYKNIFAIRGVLNTISGFQQFYFGNNLTANAIQGIAASIMAATAGVVPEALTKCVLIGVLATMETAHDMERLKAGTPVALYKDSYEDWYCSIGGVSKKEANFKNGGKEIVDEDGIYYGDYLYFFLLMGVTNSSTYSSILLRTGDLIEANMRKMGSKGDFDLSKSRCYFSINATLKVKLLLLDLPIVHSMQNVDVTSVEGSSGWCTYEVNFVRGYS